MAEFRLSADQEAALDHPIWSSLTTAHRSLAEGGSLARRYPAAIAPFAALVDETPEATAELRGLAAAAPVVLFTRAPVGRIAGLDVTFRGKGRQMVAVRGPDPAALPDTVVLGLGDVPEMLELTALTKPGPFFPRTHELGRYIGIRVDGRLAAMAGERMRYDGFTEISAVCVHPDFRGRGYAQGLVKAMMGWIAERGDVPMLHVFDDNHGAIALYESLGFASRGVFHVIRLDAAAG
jgi:ribosomal protein S18 acetylase RimI-like enzyme